MWRGRPKPGMSVRLNYKDKTLPFQGREGVVLTVASGRKMVNALVELDDGKLVVVSKVHVNEIKI